MPPACPLRRDRSYSSHCRRARVSSARTRASRTACRTALAAALSHRSGCGATGLSRCVAGQCSVIMFRWWRLLHWSMTIRVVHGRPPPCNRRASVAASVHDKLTAVSGGSGCSAGMRRRRWPCKQGAALVARTTLLRTAGQRSHRRSVAVNPVFSWLFHPHTSNPRRRAVHCTIVFLPLLAFAGAR